MTEPARWAALFGLLLVASGCGPDEPMMMDQTVFDGLPPITDLPMERWAEIRPGEPTICGRGAPFSFFVRRGDPSKLFVHFDGGGACWDSETCGISTSLFVSTVEQARARTTDTGGLGVLDFAAPENPFRDFTHVYVPYCTGDVYMGDATADYGGVTVRHNGFNNVRTVADWVFREIQGVERLTVGGCSGGGYGTMIWGPELAAAYPSAEAAFYTDGAAGVTTPLLESVFQDAWGARLPSWYEGEFPAGRIVQGLAEERSARFPDIPLGVITSEEDTLQIAFYASADGEGGGNGWRAELHELIGQATEADPSIRFYLYSELIHCTTVSPVLDSRLGGNSMTINDWIFALSSGEPPDHQRCSTCTQPVP